MRAVEGNLGRSLEYGLRGFERRIIYHHVLNRGLSGIRGAVDGLDPIHGGGVMLIHIMP
jgi:hypothetical protein